MKKRIKPKKQKANSKRAFKKLEQNIKRNMGSSFGGIIHNAPGQIKMSDALEEIIAPFADDADTIVAMKNLVGLGAMAWNITLMPPQEQIEQIQTLVQTMGSEAEDIDMLYKMIHEMMQRKQALYPDVNRTIVNFEVEDIGDGWHLSVASTLPPNQQ